MGIGEVVGIQVYANDAVVIREGTAPPVGDRTRGVITEFTRKARQRLAFVASNTSVVFRTMISLTYPKEYPRDGKRVKQDLRRFLGWLRRDTGGCEILWFLEFQQRGAPHVHIVTDYSLPSGYPARKDFRWRVSTTWWRVCGKLDPKHLAAGCRTERLRSLEGGKHYAVKYAMKMRQKVVPVDYRDVGRFWGYTVGVKPIPGARYDCTEDDVRGILEGQPYAPSDDKPVWRVLYNKADTVRAFVDTGLDRPR